MNESDNRKLGIHLDHVQFERVPVSDCQLEDDASIPHDEERTDFTNGEEVCVVSIPLDRHDEPYVKDAKQKELQNWSDFDVYTEVQDDGQPTLTTRWVICEKNAPEGKTNVKARLVVRGFEEESSIPSDSPTAAKSTLRSVIAIAASKGWSCESIDIKAAFLQGKGIDRDIYLVPPIEAQEDGILWKLNKAAYGLGDASRNWYFSVRDELIKLGCKQSELDKALFWWHNSEGLEGVFVMHVDDFLFAGTSSFRKKVIDPIVQKYKVGKWQANDFLYVGLEISKVDDGIKVQQSSYESELKEIPITMNRRSNKTSPLTKKETESLRSTAGQLNWLATQTRPDLSYEALELNMSRKEPTVEHILKANKAVRHAKNNDGGILFPRLGPFDEWGIEVYCDASWGNLPDGVSSAQGHVIYLSDGSGKSCPLSWSSNKIKRKVSSTLAAETLAMQDALDEAIYLGNLISEIYSNRFGENNLPIAVYTDNRSLHQNLHSTKQVHEKRLRINIAEIQRMLLIGDVRRVEWVPSHLQLANSLTKRGPDSAILLSTFENRTLNCT